MKSSGLLKTITFEVKPNESLNVYGILRRMEEELRMHVTNGSHLLIPGYLDEDRVLQIFGIELWAEAGKCSWWRELIGRVPVVHKIKLSVAQAHL